ncbi:NUDIX domain-containing protein [Streptomyces sp. A7024]|uniref:NUDIX domain-containing protein n=1 Tax=Streptomyces coryli TaxID=1128680 RepID=A0A6G4UAK4_9ACTN|nr:NUDIX domain-containing protein [Streptomyces coryli]NGN69032.1 NUDIX domain-containing protein [Streptomyces coryli]
MRRSLRVAAYAVCLRDDAILLSRLSESALAPGHWTLPGGGLDHREDPYDAVVREVAEETGYAVEVEALLGIHNEHDTDDHGPGYSDDHHLVRVIYATRVTGGTLREPGTALGALAFDFWNWPPLSESFHEAFRRRLGHRTDRQDGKF